MSIFDDLEKILKGAFDEASPNEHEDISSAFQWKADRSLIVTADSGTGPDAYQLALSVSKADEFPSRREYEMGEEWVARILAKVTDDVAEDVFCRIERTKDGQLNDAPDGKPAVQEYKNGREILAESYQADVKGSSWTKTSKSRHFRI